MAPVPLDPPVTRTEAAPVDGGRNLTLGAGLAASVFTGAVEGPAAWDHDPTVRRAIEIREGVIQNGAILSFQGRAPAHPHLFLHG